MLLCSRPFADATGDGLCDMREVAIAQVQQQFLDRVLNLDPWMVPRIGAIEPFQIGFVLFDVLWVLQGECKFVALHGEHPADAVRRGLQLCREVGRVGHQIGRAHV